MDKLFISLSLLLAFGVSAQDSVSNRVQFLFVGDVMQHGGQIQGAYNVKKDAYDYRDCFQFVEPVISKADIAVANLEVTHAGKPYKGYPQFSAPPELSEALVDAGFDVILTANNHACDGGGKGVAKTLDELDKLGVKHTGTFRNKAEREKNYPLLVEKNGLKVAILNYTFSTNGLSVAAPLIINYIDSTVMKADFKKAKSMGVDVIICTMHWGTEYQSLPNDYQKTWEAFCYRNGADMVIGGHPHVLQPVEKKEVGGKEKLTAWSLGNFVSNQRDRYKDGGIMLTATVYKGTNGVHFDAINHYFTWVFPRQEAVVKPFYILPDFDYNKYRTDFLDEASLKQMNVYFTDSRELFAKHSKGTSELTVGPNSAEGDRCRLLLEGYYAYELDEAIGTDWKKLDAKRRETVTKVPDCNGNYHLIYGIRNGAVEGIQTLTETTFDGLKGRLVFISPKEFKIVSE